MRRRSPRGRPGPRAPPTDGKIEQQTQRGPEGTPRDGAGPGERSGGGDWPREREERAAPRAPKGRGARQSPCAGRSRRCFSAGPGHRRPGPPGASWESGDGSSGVGPPPGCGSRRRPSAGARSAVPAPRGGRGPSAGSVGSFELRWGTCRLLLESGAANLDPVGIIAFIGRGPGRCAASVARGTLWAPGGNEEPHRWNSTQTPAARYGVPARPEDRCSTDRLSCPSP